eukprot:g3718.t1
MTSGSLTMAKTHAMKKRSPSAASLAAEGRGGGLASRVKNIRGGGQSTLERSLVRPRDKLTRQQSKLMRQQSISLLALAKQDVEVEAGDDTDEGTVAHSPKTAEQHDMLCKALAQHPLLQNVPDSAIKDCVDVMELTETADDETVCTYGEPGNTFCVVERGTFECYMPDETTGGGKMALAGRLRRGECFGEVSLLYECPSVATIVATSKHAAGQQLATLSEDGDGGGPRLWELDAVTFKGTIARAVHAQRGNDVRVLESCNLFKDLAPDQLASVCDRAHRTFFKTGTPVLRKGHPGENMFVVCSGVVVCSDLDGLYNDVQLSAGEVFGEEALLADDATRASNVTALSDCVCLACDRLTLGDCLGLVRSRLTKSSTEHDMLFYNMKLLDGLEQEGKQALLEACTVREYPADEQIYDPMREADVESLYIIRSGAAKMVMEPEPATLSSPIKQAGVEAALSASGARSGTRPRKRSARRRSTFSARLGKLVAGDVFGEHTMGGRARTASIIATERCVCYVAPYDTFLRLIQRWQDIPEAIARHWIQHRVELAMARPTARIDLRELEPTRVLGTGGLGRVWLTRHKDTADPFAVKVMHKAVVGNNNDEEAVLREMKIMADLRHPFILRLVTAMHGPSHIYFILEYVEGGDLFDYIHSVKGGRLDEKTACFYMACVSDALADIHEQNIAYRDLKPENVMLDEQGYVKIVDFGFAKELNACAGRTYSQVGTVEYFAPELVNPARGHDRAVDLWAFGVLLYEIIVGHTPFAKSSGDRDDTMGAILDCDYSMHSRIKSKSLRDLIRRLLVIDPYGRLGRSRRGVLDVQSHAWFQENGINWGELCLRKRTAPWVPKIKSPAAKKAKAKAEAEAEAAQRTMATDLAAQRVVFVEKWEGPCWNECLENSSQAPPLPCSPACDEAQYQLATIAAIKALNPAVACAFYLNALYAFPYYSMVADFDRNGWLLRDVRGALVRMENDNGMKHVPVWDWSQAAAVDAYLSFHRALAARGNVSGTFPDKPNVYAFEARNGSWWVCENPGGPPRGHAWDDACGEVTAATAAAWNAGKDALLDGLLQIYGPRGALGCTSSGRAQAPWPVSFAGKAVLSRAFSDPALAHAQMVAELANHSYVYAMMGDSGTTAMACGCRPVDVVVWLLVLERGAILGCNGRSASTKHPVPPLGWWDAPLGPPLGVPQPQRGGSAGGGGMRGGQGQDRDAPALWTRTFASGTVVRYSTATRNGTIEWAQR